MAFALEHGERHRLERRKLREEGVDLEGARESSFHPPIRAKRSDLLAAQEDLPGIGREHAGEKIHERGLAGAVGPDKGIANALRQLERDVLRDDERAEFLVQAFRGKNLPSPPRMPFGRNITTTTSSSPIQKYQYCGLMPENWSRATM